MSEHLTKRARMSRWKSHLSPDCQRLVNNLAHKSEKAKKTEKPFPEMRYNEFLITVREVAAEVGISTYATSRAIRELIELGCMVEHKIPGCKKTCVRWTDVCKWRKTNDSSLLENYEANLTKYLKKSHRFCRIPSKTLKLKKEKGRGNGVDSPRPSSLPSAVEAHQKQTLKTLSRKMGGTGQKHTLYFVSPLGIHPVAPEGHRDTTPPVWTHQAFEAFLGHCISLGADLHRLPRLDRKASSDLTHRGRKALLRRVCEYYRDATGTQEQRRQHAEERIKGDILGNYQDWVERNNMGKVTIKYAELYDVFGAGSEAHRERKGWCVERGRQTMNETWQTQGRFEEGTRKQRERERKAKDAMRDSVEELSLLSRQLAHDFMKGRLSLKAFGEKMDEVDLRLAEAHAHKSPPPAHGDLGPPRRTTPVRSPQRAPLRLVQG